MRKFTFQINLLTMKYQFTLLYYDELINLRIKDWLQFLHSQQNTTNESQEVSPFPAGDKKAHINRRAKMHSKRKTEKKTIKDQQKKYRPGTVSKLFASGLKPILRRANLTLNAAVDQDT